jgi:hypothetical protein
MLVRYHNNCCAPDTEEPVRQRELFVIGLGSMLVRCHSNSTMLECCALNIDEPVGG